MNIFTKAYLLQHVLYWRLTWNRRNTHYAPPASVKNNPLFKSPYDAAGLIPDGAVVATAGMGGNMRPSVLYWAIRENFEQRGHPRDLTLLNTGGQGGRGKAPGTMEELGLPGLNTRIIAGHVETYKSQLQLAHDGHLEVQIIPQGQVCALVEAQMRGEKSIVTHVGVGTFVDPRVGTGSSVLDPSKPGIVTVEGDLLRYEMPTITACVFNAPAADRKGNIYVKNAALKAESKEIALAVRKNNGVCLITVGGIVEEGYDEIFLPADVPSAIAYYPGTEQTGSVPHRKYWSFLTTNSTFTLDEGLSRTRYINQVLKITPERKPIDNAMGRLAACMFAESGFKGMYVNIGIGLPEEVSRLIYEGGLVNDVTFLTESGAFGGVPTPGVFFGAEVNPKELRTAPETFRFCHAGNLDVTVLGFLQIDSNGNVNSSKRGNGAINLVGPGGFVDFSTAAKTVIFVGSYMAKADFAYDGKTIKLNKPGIPKIVDKVDEITFSGQEAIKRKQKVFFCTNVGVFIPTDHGLELIRVMPGIDIQKDILDLSPAKIHLPANGVVPVVDDSIVSGEGFKLKLAPKGEAGGGCTC